MALYDDLQQTLRRGVIGYTGERTIEALEAEVEDLRGQVDTLKRTVHLLANVLEGPGAADANDVRERLLAIIRETSPEEALAAPATQAHAAEEEEVKHVVTSAYRGAAPADSSSDRCVVCGRKLDLEGPELSVARGKACMSCYGRAAR